MEAELCLFTHRLIITSQAILLGPVHTQAVQLMHLTQWFWCNGYCCNTTESCSAQHVYTAIMGCRRNACVITCAKCSCTRWVWTGAWGARMIVRAECRSEDRLHPELHVCLFLLAILTVYILGEMVRDVKIWSHSGKLSYSSGPEAEGDKVARWPRIGSLSLRKCRMMDEVKTNSGNEPAALVCLSQMFL